MTTYAALTIFPVSFQASGSGLLASGSLVVRDAVSDALTNVYTDTSGTSAGNTITLNSRGEPTVSNNVVNLYGINGAAYKFTLFDAGGSQIWSVDNVLCGSSTGQYDMTEAEFKASTILVAGDVVTLSDRAGGTFDIASGTSGANGFDIIANTAATLKAALRLDNGNTSFRALGAVGDGVTSNNSLFSRIDVLLSDGATIYGHPDDNYLISGFRSFTKSITIDMQGGTISSAALSNTALLFYANSKLLNATMDNVWISFSNDEVTYGYVNNNRFINQTYYSIGNQGGASGVVIDGNYFEGLASGPTGTANYPCFQAVEGCKDSKFINNYCLDVYAAVTWAGITENCDGLLIAGNTMINLTYYVCKMHQGNNVTVENNYIENAQYCILHQTTDTAGAENTHTAGNQIIVRNNYMKDVEQGIRGGSDNQYVRIILADNYMEECLWGMYRASGHTLITGNHFYNGNSLFYYGGGSISCRDLTIENNVIDGGLNITSEGNDTDSHPIKGSIILGALTDTQYRTSVLVRNNTIIDYHTNGIMVASLGSSQNPRVTITDNKFDAGANSVNHIVIGASRDLVVTRNREITAPTGDELRYIRLDRNVGFPQVYENDWQYTTASPTTDTHLLGTKYTHSAPASAGYIGFVCVFAFGTTLSAGEPSGETSMAVAAGTGTANGDIVGVVQDDGTIHWTTVSSGGGTTTIVLTSGITDDAASGNRVYFHRWKSYGLIA